MSNIYENDKVKYNEYMIGVANKMGIKTRDINITSTTQFMMSLMDDYLDNGSSAISFLNRDKFVVTAQTQDSLIKHARAVSMVYKLADPSICEVRVSIKLEDIEEHGEDNGHDDIELKLLTEDVTIHVGKYGYSLLHDITVTRYIKNGNPRYKAEYDISHFNPIDKSNDPTILIKVEGEVGHEVLSLDLIVAQYKRDRHSLKYVDNVDTISYTLDFTEQLCDFNIRFKDNYGDREINKAVFIDDTLQDETMFYTLDTDRLTVINKYEAGDFYPTRNGEFTIDIYTTKGIDANFDVYTGDIIIDMGIDAMYIPKVQILSSSILGADVMSEEDLRRDIIDIKSRRDSIIFIEDIKDYFEKLSTSNNKYDIRKLVDGIYTRIFNNFITCIDVRNDEVLGELSTLVPTNTLDITLGGRITLVEGGVTAIADDYGTRSSPRQGWDEYSSISDIDRYWVMRNNEPIFSKDHGVGTFHPSANDAKHIYYCPYLLSYSVTNNSVDVYDGMVDKWYNTKYTFVSDEFDKTYRLNKVHFSFSGVIERGDGNYIGDSIRVYKIFAYIQGNGFDIDATEPIHVHIFFREQGKYRYFPSSATHLYATGVVDEDGFLEYSTEIKCRHISVYDNKLELDVGVMDDLFTHPDDYDTIVTGRDEHYPVNMEDLKIEIAIMNVYTPTSSEPFKVDDEWVRTVGGRAIVNYFSIPGATLLNDRTDDFCVQVKDHEFTTEGDLRNVTLCRVPVIKADYYDVHEYTTIKQLVTGELDFSKVIQYILESNYGLRNSFVNTYGLSNTFTVGLNGEALPSTDIRLTFIIKYAHDSELQTIDLKIAIARYVESLDFSRGDDFHISELIQHIENKYGDDLILFQFDGLNDYPLTYQYISAKKGTYGDDVIPEVLNLTVGDTDYNNITIIELLSY